MDCTEGAKDLQMIQTGQKQTRLHIFAHKCDKCLATFFHPHPGRVTKCQRSHRYSSVQNWQAAVKKLVKNTVLPDQPILGRICKADVKLSVETSHS